jgi:isopentenyl-diphosphate delta-isomerase
MIEEVILVNENDSVVGYMEKMEAHRLGLLHRAFSVFVFNAKGELMLQKRAKSKYHSGGLWTNTCCSHPRSNETVVEAAKRRMQEEMGFVCEVEEKFSFVYKAKLDNELTEHEYDYVLFGNYNEAPKLNPEEAESYRFMSIEEVKKQITEHPQNYTEWFKICFPRVFELIKNKN